MKQAGGATAIGFVGDQSLLVRCVDIAREAGLDVTMVASHNHDVLTACAAEGTELVALTTPLDLEPALESMNFDALLSVAYLHIIPKGVLDRAEIALNFHDGPLPDYAGLNVTSWAVANGETSHSVTWHELTSKVDAGHIVREVSFPIEPADTALELNARCFEAGAQSFADIARSLAEGTLQSEPQPDRPRRLYLRRERPIVVVDPQRPAADTAQVIRALHVGDRVVNTIGSARLVIDDRPYLVGNAEAQAGSGQPAGSITAEASGDLRLATSDGDLVLRDLRDLGGRPATVSGTHIDSPTETLAVLTELDADLADNEDWWRGQLGIPFETSTFEDLDLEHSPATASIQLTTEPQTVGAALAMLLARRADGDTISLAVTNDATSATLSRLPSLLSPPQVHVNVDSEHTAGELAAHLDEATQSALDRGPYLTDLVARDPSLRGSYLVPAARLHMGAGPVQPTHAPLDIAFDGTTLQVTGPAPQSAIDGIASQLAHLVTQLDDAPDQPLRSVDLRTDADRAALAELNATTVSYELDTIDRQFQSCVSTSGDQPAVSCAGQTLSYSELAERVDELAGRLQDAGVRSRDIVGIALDRSVDLIASVLAVLRLGAAYLPLDPGYPADRLRFMVSDSSTRVVIGTNAMAASLGADLTAIDPSLPTPAEPVAGVADHAPDDLAYVIYTSGSTGTPKGVQLEHRQVANFFVGMDAVIDSPEPGVWLAVTSLSFDISVLELLWTLTRGFHVVIKQDSGFQPVRSFSGDAPSMSLFHFAAGGDQAGDGYRLLLESSRWGDEHGFEAVWTPERHFHDFGAPYPNPSVVAAAVAAITERIQIRAGSVVLPLHSPVRVAEEWSVVDNLSRGRVGISFAAGWQPNDFVLNPAGYENAREELPERIDAVRRLWRGETVDLPGHDGEPVSVKTLPRPVQEELPVWLTSAGSPASFERAGRLGVNLLTHLLGQSVEQLTENIERYRAARQEAGHPGKGKVTLMLHTFLDEDATTARETARGPLTQYLGTAVGLIKNMASSFPTFAGAGKDSDEAFSSLSDDDIAQLLDLAADRYLSTSGLFGTVDDALDMIAIATKAGVDEVACLIDFGIDADKVLPSLELLGQVHDRLMSDDEQVETVATLIERYGVTHLQCTPSLASMLMADPAERASLAHLDHMMVGGEALPNELATELVETVPGRVTNMYGPTETTIWSLTYDVDAPPTGPIPIGTPIANTSVHILDRHQRELPVGEFGELYLGGDGVSRGYLDRPELNRERFIELEGVGRVYATGDIARVVASGLVEFAGRSDGQVKIRGHRIEVGEIESVLDQQESVARSVVVARGPGEPTLVAFVVPMSGQAPDTDLLTKCLGELLPAAMVPTHIEVIDSLPLTPNGKVDRKELQHRERSTTTSGAGATAVAEGSETLVAEVWQDQLGRSVGRTDNFFDIGGHSLLAVNVFRSLSETTGAAISLTDVFRYPTVAQFAAHLDQLLGGDPSDAGQTPKSTGTDRGSRRRRALGGRRGGEAK